ncbi:hypothetical protein ACOSQ2_025225 [Xanthoceras sorbifolium]
MQDKVEDKLAVALALEVETEIDNQEVQELTKNLNNSDLLTEEDKNPTIHIPSSKSAAQKLELKPLPSTLKYAYLSAQNTLPVIMEVLKLHSQDQHFSSFITNCWTKVYKNYIQALLCWLNSTKAILNVHPSQARNPPTRPGRLPYTNPPTQNPLQHPEYNRRYERFAKRTIIQERGIGMDELSNTFVPMIIHRRGW